MLAYKTEPSRHTVRFSYLSVTAPTMLILLLQMKQESCDPGVETVMLLHACASLLVGQKKGGGGQGRWVMDSEQVDSAAGSSRSPFAVAGS